ncbi:unnamed protein product (macronuclear) [Paramecium tetraurelia]|uniref:Uncharacterized protein n=1 Tax=Paramecium tetraurelia TaxID=5888 RepID=A0DHH0_PARTE|nr:uncharacterized protein GSPATT00016874001 [Paramecium tetraurelia]CAK82487.1 unnamed protein product [Paramecium tetraurelia]|eukprot:XP_001449884.1 hypothetical protein (macronuclear) [Paramecium tetraurelia strain d4-2]
MISKMIMDRQKKTQNIDENELDSFNRYLQRDNQPLNLGTQLSYSKIKVNVGMPIITEQQNETLGNTHQSTVQQSKNASPQKISIAMEDIRLNIRIVFKFYASFGNRNNTRFLKSNKFIKMLSDAQIMPQLLSNRDCDILYAQQTKNNESLTLEQFQNLIPKLAMILYPQQKVHQAFQKLYNEYLSQLSQKILNFTEFGQQIQFVLQPIGNQIKEFVEPIQQQLTNLHKFIFEDQSTNINKVQWKFMQFLTQCEILPNYINQSQAQLIFDNIQIRQPTLNLQESGNYLFSLNNFVESLIIISRTVPNLDEFTQFRLLLDKIEQSEGFSQYLRNLNRTQSDKVRLFYNIEKSGIYKQENLIQQSQVIQNTQNNVSHTNIQVLNTNKKVDESRVNLSMMKQSKYLQDIDQSYISSLKKLFEFFAQSGEPSNIQSLKNTKFNKLLLHSGILNNLITITDSDMIYSKLCGLQSIKTQQKNKQLTNGKMTFGQFQISLGIIAEKCGMDINELIQQNILPLEKQISDDNKEQILQVLVDLLQDEQIIQLYEMIQTVFDWYFQEYSKQQSSILYLSEFLKFCQDFELSNILISQTQLTSIFYSVASLNQEGQEYSDQIFLDKSQFVEAISIIAIQIYSTIPNNIQRIVYLLERIFQSQNASKIYVKQNKLQARFQNVIEEIKYRFLEKDKVRQEEEQYNFDDLVNGTIQQFQ